MSVRVALQAAASDRSSWLRIARDVEAAGFDALYAADHPGTAPAPFVALAAAAAVTERIELGTCVANAGMWEPIPLASAVATLDVVSDGRALLGLGAGHTPREWTTTGRAYPSAGDRVGRMIEVVQATCALLGGEPISYAGRHVTLENAMMVDPRPVQARIPLLVGGNGERVLRFAARHADVVGITGLGRTLANGHGHEVSWSVPALRRSLEIISSAAADVGREPQLEALVQVVEITDDAQRSAEKLAEKIAGTSWQDLLQTPFVWLGTAEEIRTKLRNLDRELGIRRYVVRAAALTDARRIVISGI